MARDSEQFDLSSDLSLENKDQMNSLDGGILTVSDNKSAEIPPVASYPVQRSNKASSIPKVYGTVRVAGNILWMGPNHPWVIKKSAGGKGGGGDSVVTDSGNRRSFLIGLCEGPVVVLRVWKGKEEISLNGLTFFNGNGSVDTGINALTGEVYSNYPNTCCVFFNEFEIGTGGALPNFTFEVVNYTAGNIPITTLAGLQAMNDNLNGNYELLVDIDATATSGWNGGEGFLPIGDPLSFPNNVFQGTLEGNGHVISNLFINRPTESRIGLFRYIGGGTIDIPTVSNLTMKDVNFTANGWGGMFAGQTEGTLFTNCHVIGGSLTASPAGLRNFGGFCGSCHANPISTSRCVFTRCSSSGGTITIPRRGWGIAGLIGEGNDSDCIDCFTNVTIVRATLFPASHTWDAIGGFIGINSNRMDYTRCYAAGIVPSAVAGDQGGFTGDDGPLDSTWTDCFWDTDSTGQALSNDTATGKTTGQMIQEATFTNYDFDLIWNIVEGISRPTLRGIDFSGDDANPAVIIKDLLINDRYGAGINESLHIDTASFSVVKNYCDANNLLYSFSIDQQKPVLDWIDLILQHFSGYMFMSQGKINLGIFKDES